MSIPMFAMRAILVAEAEVNAAMTTSLAVWDGEKAERLRADLRYDLEQLLPPCQLSA